MKLIHFGLSGILLDEDIDFTEWIVESPESFSGYVLELSTQIDGNEGQFVLSEKNKELDLAKKAELIFDPLTVALKERQILNKLYLEFSDLSNR